MAINRPDMVQADGSPFYAEFVDDTRRGMWAIGDENAERYVLLGLSKEQALFGLMMLDNEGISFGEPDELPHALEVALEAVPCTICQKHFMRAQLHNERCPADLS